MVREGEATRPAGGSANARRRGRGGDAAWAGEVSAQEELADIQEADREIKRAGKAAGKGGKTSGKGRARVSLAATVSARAEPAPRGGKAAGKKAASRKSAKAQR
jgi:hypothetical protein